MSALLPASILLQFFCPYVCMRFPHSKADCIQCTYECSGTICTLIFAGFIFHGFVVFAFLNSRLLGQWCWNSRVKYSRRYGVSLYTIIIYGTCRGAKLAGLIIGFVWRYHRIKWRAASEDFTSTRRYGRLSLEKGLVALAKEATEKIRSQLQWREALQRSAMYRARSRASVRSSCSSVGPSCEFTRISNPSVDVSPF